jgi:hypothetical protein
MQGTCRKRVNRLGERGMVGEKGGRDSRIDVKNTKTIVEE